MTKDQISLLRVSKDYDGSEAIKDLTLHIRKNEFLTMLGPSGCGKTTTLRIIGGFEYPTSGDILFDGKNIKTLPPYKRKVNTVFQKYALFPHLNVYENIAFGLHIKKLDKKTIAAKVGHMLDLVNLTGYEKRSITSLSGGQQQRIAIARALVNEPEVLLLDEPLGALDLKLRKDMQLELKAMQQHLEITFIYVTHDQEEALTMSDTIVVMNQGRIQQTGDPVSIYNEPINSFVAGFIGTSNIIPGIMLAEHQIQLLGQTLYCQEKGFTANQEIEIVIRPEDLQLVDETEGDFKGIVNSIIFKGVHYEIIVFANEVAWRIHSTHPCEVGARVGLKILPTDIHIMEKVI